MAYPQFRSKSENFTASGTSVVATEPPGAAQDDILLYGLVIGSGGGTITGPTGGWTTLATINGANALFRLYIIRRGSGAPGYTSSWTSAAYGEYAVLAYRGCDTGSSLYHALAQNASTQRNPQNPDCPAVTITIPETTVVAIGMGWNGWSAGGATKPAGYELRTGATTGFDLATADFQRATAGVEDPSAFANGTASLNDVAEVTIALMGPQNAPRGPFVGSFGRRRTRYAI